MPRLKDIVGHREQLDELLSDIASDNVAHAYLFSGPRHLGKLTVATWFAHELLKQGLPEEEAERLAGSVERLMHPDLLVLDQLWIEDVCEDWETIARTSNVPQTHRSKKPPARTDTISIDDVRTLQERLYETGTGRWRCCIIRSVERMQDAAANAFLKILEEPPPSLVFLLTTQAESSLLPTIISRTRVLRFRRLTTKELRPLLDGVPEDDAAFIQHLAQGSPGAAERLQADPDLLRQRRLLHTRAGSLWKAATLRERLDILSPLKERGRESDEFLEHLALTLREKSPALPAARVRALHQLARGLETNAQRQLLVQQFALSL